MSATSDGFDRGRGMGAGFFREDVAALREALSRLDSTHCDAVLDLAAAVDSAWNRGGKLLVCGNGGSAADSQHIVAELVGRFHHDRPAYGALALTANSSITTAVGNDYGFNSIFARQVEGLGDPADVLLVISTSGNSGNCLRAVEAARARGMKVFGFLGGDGGRLLGMVDGALVAPSAETPRIQEIHIAMGHLLCRTLESVRDAVGGGDE